MDDALLESGARVVSRGATAARKLAAEIVPMWNNDSAANTMEFTSALKAVMIEGFGPVTGLMDAVYSGKVDETEDGFGADWGCTDAPVPPSPGVRLISLDLA